MLAMFELHKCLLVISIISSVINQIHGANETMERLNEEDSTVSASWKVVGGSEAIEHQFPYIVSLRNQFNYHVCGGSIVNQRWIVTAAHCLQNTNARDVNVIAGTNYLNQGGTKYQTSQFIIHPNYGGAHKNDIALIQVSYPIKFDQTVSPIELGRISEFGPVGAILSGWGGSRAGAPPINNLQQITLTTLTIGECQNYLPEVDASQICTFVRQGQGACHGDSGGPLVANGFLVGIVSYGIPCAKGMPDVFTRVSYHFNWIRQFTG